MYSSKIHVLPCEMENLDTWADRKTDFKTDLLQDYFSSITENNVDGVKQLLSSVKEEEKDILVNGKFNFDNEKTVNVLENDRTSKKDKSELYILSQLRVRRPIALAAAYGSIEVFGYLLKAGADIFIPKEDGSGIINIMIAASNTNPDLQENMLRIYDVILDRYPEAGDRKRLLLEESDGNLSPLEAAMKLRTFGLFRSILYTDGVFLDVKSQHGKVVEYEFDLSIYGRTGERCENNPLYFLDYIRYAEMEKLVESGIMNIPVLKAWIARKVNWSKPFIIFWAMFRCVWPIVFFCYEQNYATSSNKAACTKGNTSIDYVYTLVVEDEGPGWKFLLVASSVSMAIPTLVTDIMEMIFLIQKQPNYCNSYKGLATKSSYIVNFGVFRACQLMLATLGVALAFSQIVGNAENYFFVVIMSTLIRFLMLFSLLFFAQAIPVMGFFIIGFQQMIVALLNFILLFFTVLVTFLTLFKGIGLYLCQTNGLFTNCNLGDDFYNTFLVLLNMASIHEQKCLPVGTTLMQVVHMLYIFIISLLIINYLIAVMSTVYSDLSQYQDQVTTLYHLHFANLIECRLQCFLKCCCLSRKQVKDGPLIINTTEVDSAFHTHHRSKNQKLSFSK
jgi:hypothetical protein